MSENTLIEWADHTFNPWEGCQKVGPGCDHCYAEARNARFGGGQAANWGPGAPRRRTSPANWRKPLAWNRQRFMECHACGWRGALAAEVIGCGRCGSTDNLGDARQRVFCASLADVFDNEVDPAWRAALFRLIADTPNLDWLLLTKRIGNVPNMLGDYRTVPLLSNIWLGATVVNQAEADRDIPKLLAVPARVRFLSIEPMLGPISLSAIPVGGGHGHHEFDPVITGNVLQRAVPSDPSVHWVICGGESGPKARPMHPDWARSLRDQCNAACVPFLFKQWGEWREPLEGERFDTTMGRAQRVPAFIMSEAGTVHCFQNDQTREGGRVVLRVGKKASGRLLDGREHNGFPGG